MLSTPFRVDVGGALLGISRTRENGVCHMRTGIAVVALINDESLVEFRRIDLVGAKQIDHLDVAAVGARKNARRVSSAFARQETKIQPADPRGRRVQHIETVPVAVNHAEGFGRLACQPQDRRAVVPG